MSEREATRREALRDALAALEKEMATPEAQRCDPFANGLQQAIWVVGGLIEEEQQ